MKKRLKHLLLMAFVILNQAQAIPFTGITESGSSARHIALGSIDGFSKGADSIFETPAALYRIKTYALNSFSSSILGDFVHYNNLAIAGKFKEGSWAIGICEVIHPNQPYTFFGQPMAHNRGGANYAEPQGIFDIKRSIIKAGYQYSPIETRHFGATINWYNDNMIDSVGRGWDIDLGVIQEWNNLEISCTLKNGLKNRIYSKTQTYNQEKQEYITTYPTEDLSRELNISAKYIWKRLFIMPQIEFKRKKIMPSIGLEYTPWFFKQMTLYAGSESSLMPDNSTKRRLSTGIGLNLGILTMYYAYKKSETPTTSLIENDQHHFSIEIIL
ncbi:MAG: hypothetical protein VW378_07715 [bacterium]